MPIRLHDSLTRSIKELRRPNPADPKDVFSFYNCGPTVYGPAHIGNFRTFVINDVLRRLLVLEYGADKVKYVRNLTDVDDKTIKRARDEGRPLADVTKLWTDKFHQDCAALNCLPMEPGLEPTATGYIKEQVDMIDVLMKKGNAYRAADGSVYFKVSSFDDYGKLSRVKERELQAGATLKIAAADADEKEDVSDFALWKAHKPDDGENAWDSPWGRGRPGWHIECSAMSKALLGNTIDLHTGGEDLEFPHHENEIAQSECCNGTTFSRHWFHSKHLLVDGKKMSKSLGNLYTLDDLSSKLGPIYDPIAVRLALMQAHPRKQQNFSLGSIESAEAALTGLSTRYAVLKGFLIQSGQNPRSAQPTTSYDGVTAALKNDLNLPAALAALFEQKIHNDPNPAGELLAFERALRLLGLKIKTSLHLPDDHLAQDVAVLITQQTKADIPAAITALADKRWAAKQTKDWAGADALRKELTTAGWSMLDSKDSYRLEPLKK